ncbi:sodium/calcium exchanger 3 isoform X2 [Arctopsyche grandis]|uniref:sodium/calcium exchanger 3 isoform X2 n=1 Tax=Arctopsyche grandis TaxID=121162 RepID=UPI00406D8137
MKPSVAGLPLLLLLLALFCLSAAHGVENGVSSANVTSPRRSDGTHECIDGLVMPAWRPIQNITVGDKVLRGFVYFSIMLYLFIGVSIISDRFMAAIEVITSQEKEVRVKKPNGDTQIVVVRVWNETVANLTLMALGSSAPEILLSIIEIVAKNFKAGDLGPGTIVGSAAYNLFVIIAICVLVIPKGEVRKIKHLRVFFVTATWSVFAYVWLYLILAVFSPGELEVWEGLLTFTFFPMTVCTAWVADRRLFIYKYLNKKYRINKRGVVVQVEGGDNSVEMELKNDGMKGLEEEMSDEVKDFEQHRKEYITTLKELRKQYPQNDLDSIECMAHELLLNKGPKSRAFYRVQATRKMMGSGNIMRKISERAQSDLSEVKAELQKQDIDEELAETGGSHVHFEPGHYTVMENCGEFEVRVVRTGETEEACSVDFHTEDGTAEDGSDYIGKKGTLTFEPGETEKRFTLEVIDDDVFEEDEHFYIRLSDARGVTLASPSLATVMILDDDHGGVFAFAERDHELVESVGTYDLRVVRYSGARGRVALPYWTEDGTAKQGHQYEAIKGEIVFENNEVEKFIPLRIIEEDSYEKDVLFYVNLGDPQMVGEMFEVYLPSPKRKFSVRLPPATLATIAESKHPDKRTEEEKVALLGKPKSGDVMRAQMRVKESKEFKNTVDKLVQRANASILIGTSSWKEQFVEALTVSSGEEDEDGEPKKPSCFDYFLHILTVFWKVIFAFVPPTDIAGGYLCFVVSILSIGVVTAIIGDVASHFGCTLGIKDSVTAIVFVALGTSIPDTFASKVAAIQDKYADASVGNVTGSNAVNVFLGIGIAWSIAAIYHNAHGNKFLIDPGNLAFSVTIFCSEAMVTICILLLRRHKSIGGELGGDVTLKYITAAFMFGLWLIYLILSTLEAYDYIEGF